MNPLAEALARRIRAQGPLTVAEFMADALGHPDYGYYMTRDPLGRAGDFTTAPEVSQIFGELIGLWCVDLWDRAGRPDPFLLVELGPGRGTLLADALRAARVVPAFARAARLHLVETSPTLRRAQEKTLRGHDLTWHEVIATLPAGPLIVIANEFFDALPIRQFVKTAAGWHEKLVGLSAEKDGFTFALSPETAAATALVPAVHRAAKSGAVCEIGTVAAAMTDALTARLVTEGGAALVIDYGYFPRGLGDTLQALQRHRRHDPLEAPGEADLTAHVDFQTLAETAAAAGGRVVGPIAQGSFLAALGIGARTQRLLENASPGQAADIGIAVRRLIDPGEMGTLFKVLAIVAPHWPAPAGF